MNKKAISALLIFSLLICIISSGHADTIQPRYSHVHTIAAGVELNGDSLWCFGQGAGIYLDTYTFLSVRLQRLSEDGGSWTTHRRWSDSSSGPISSVVDTNVTVSPGYYYRVYVITQIQDADGNILETVSMYSRVVHYPATP